MQEGKLTVAAVAQRQNGRWFLREPVLTVLPVDDQQSAFKRSLAANLLVLRAGAYSQLSLAEELTERGAVTSEATVRRWEDPSEPHVPDAWQVNRLCEILECEPEDLVRPEALTEREIRIAQRISRARRRAREDDGGPG